MLRKEREGWGTRPECLPRHPSAAEAIRTVVTLAARLEVVPFPIHHPQDNKAGAACAAPLQSQKQRARAPAPHNTCTLTFNLPRGRRLEIPSGPQPWIPPFAKSAKDGAPACHWDSPSALGGEAWRRCGRTP